MAEKTYLEVVEALNPLNLWRGETADVEARKEAIAGASAYELRKAALHVTTMARRLQAYAIEKTAEEFETGDEEDWIPRRLTRVLIDVFVRTNHSLEQMFREAVDRLAQYVWHEEDTPQPLSLSPLMVKEIHHLLTASQIDRLVDADQLFRLDRGWS